MFWIAPAASPTPAQDLRTLITPEDYPASAVQRKEQGAALPELLVDPSGRVVSCTIVASSGYSDLDSMTCSLLRKRARFAPVTGPDGNPAYKLERTVITFGLGGPFRAVQNPDIELSINQAPPGVTLPFDIWVGFLRKADGIVQSCHGSPARTDVPKILLDFACKAVAEPPLRVVRNPNKQPVDALDSATVRFVVDKR
jgi:TonB family protein